MNKHHNRCLYQANRLYSLTTFSLSLARLEVATDVGTDATECEMFLHDLSLVKFTRAGHNPNPKHPDSPTLTVDIFNLA